MCRPFPCLLDRPIQAFDEWLAAQSLALEAVVGGVSALALLNIIDRQTRDFDILSPALSEEVMAAARAFAAHLRTQGVDLDDDWLNNGPMELGDVLPKGWQQRVTSVFDGAALRLTTLGRPDLLNAKLFALCDRGTDLADCLALAPASDELDAAEPWLIIQDAHPQWPDHVRATLDDLRRRLAHGL